MCGIVAYAGPEEAAPILLDGLKRLEYRGYDSAGIAILHNGAIEIRREAGKLAKLIQKVQKNPAPGNLGIGHTRWATHGQPNETNAHPHMDSAQEVVVVHNGIVENFLALKEELLQQGVTFRSDTDSETIAHLIGLAVQEKVPLKEAVRRTARRLRGAHSIVALSRREPDRIVAVRLGNAGGVAVGIGKGEMYLSSDMPALLDHTRRMAFLEPGQIVEITRDGFSVSDLEGQPVSLDAVTVPWDAITAEKGPYKHFMQKEIHEQARAVGDTMSGRLDVEHDEVHLPTLNLTADLAQTIRRVVLIGCGTAAHAGMIGRLLIERIAHIPAEAEVASEWRHRDPILDSGTLVIAVSQSGETADTLAAMEEAKRKGAMLWSIVNVIGSQAMRIADGYLSMQSGPEIGVASTKAFVTPLVDLFMVAMLLAQARGVSGPNERRQQLSALCRLPGLVGECLNREKEVLPVAEALKGVVHCLYLGRGINMPIAYEGALKLKEISYIHAEGYPAGEMKHGPIALIDKNMPVVALALQDPWYEKMRNQVEQAKARGGLVVAVCTDGDRLLPPIADYTLFLPAVEWMLSPVLSIIPLQLLAYHIAVLRGCDVDQPRNLAKSVTVE